jgi:hypothetical protein
MYQPPDNIKNLYNIQRDQAMTSRRNFDDGHTHALMDRRTDMSQCKDSLVGVTGAEWNWGLPHQ